MREAPARRNKKGTATASLASRSRVALITGCSSGIGLALAREFAQRGWIVVATTRRPQPQLLPAAQGFCNLPLEVTSTEQIAALVARVEREQGRLDLLINNAGYGLVAPLLDLPPSAVEAQFRTNVFGPLELVRAAAPLLRRSGGGIIANIGSVSGVLGTPFAGAYCASKAAINMLSDVLRLEMAPFGIRVVNVQPGAIASSFGDAAERGCDWVGAQSWYHPFLAAVSGRARESQRAPMPAEEFARRLAAELLKPTPSAVVRIGPHSASLPFFKAIIPVPWLDRVLLRRSGLPGSAPT